MTLKGKSSEEVESYTDSYPISIIIPAYNSARFITKTLESVINQTANNYEIIVVDDGSKDDTSKIVKDIFSKITRNDLQIKLLWQTNAGESAARNFGLQSARGEYVMFFDSDDLMNPDCIEKLLSAVKFEKYDNVIFGIDFLHENEKLNYRYLSKYQYIQNTISGLEAITHFLSGKIYICVENIIHRRHYLYNNHLLFTVGCKHGPDIEFNIKVLLHSQSVGCVPNSLVKYIHREGSVSRDISHIFEAIETLKRIIAYLELQNAPRELIDVFKTKKIPETYCSILLVHIHAGYTIHDVVDIMKKEEIISSLKRFKSQSFKQKIIFFTLTRFPIFFFTVAKFKRNFTLRNG